MCFKHICLQRVYAEFSPFKRQCNFYNVFIPVAVKFGQEYELCLGLQVQLYFEQNSYIWIAVTLG